jgi:hypothetical protein
MYEHLAAVLLCAGCHERRQLSSFWPLRGTYKPDMGTRKHGTPLPWVLLLAVLAGSAAAPLGYESLCHGSSSSICPIRALRLASQLVNDPQLTVFQAEVEGPCSAVWGVHVPEGHPLHTATSSALALTFLGRHAEEHHGVVSLKFYVQVSPTAAAGSRLVWDHVAAAEAQGLPPQQAPVMQLAAAPAVDEEGEREPWAELQRGPSTAEVSG